MKFRVLKTFDWDGRHYTRGMVIDIPEGHPRLRPLLEQSRHITYDASEGAVKPTKADND